MQANKANEVINTLSELIKQETGIITYKGNAVAVSNWCGTAENCLPHILVLGVFNIPINVPFREGYFDGAEVEEVTDIRDAIPGSICAEDKDGYESLNTELDILYDPESVLAQFFIVDDEPMSGTIYTLENGVKIIAPDGWD